MKYISYTSALSVLVPLFFLMLRRKHLSPYHWPLLILLIGSAISDGYSYYISGSMGMSNIVVVHLFYLFQFLVVSVMFFYMFDKREYWIRFLILIVLYTTYFVVDNFVLHNIQQYNSRSLTISTVVIITLSLLYYRYMLLNLPTKYIAYYSPFWINTGVAFYFVFNSVLFFASHYVFNSMPSESAWVFWSYHNVNNIIKNILFAVGVYYANED
jgi:hypothetical protein